MLVARCDGKPIVWPERTHAPRDSEEVITGKCKPWRSAAEIIDWSIPGYSIFDSKEEILERYGVRAMRPLKPNTLRRVIRGVDKFTIKSGKPFIVQQKFQNTAQDVNNPLTTVTAVGAHALVEPILATMTIPNTCNSVGSQASEPVYTITSAGNQLFVAANLIQYHTEKSENIRGQSMKDAIMTVDSSNRYGLASASLVEYYGNGNPIDVAEPMHTVTAHDREAVCAAHIVEFKGQDIGQEIMKPLRTITASAGEFAQCNAVLAKAVGHDLGHWPEIRELLNQHCGYHLADDEVILLVVFGVAYYIADITLRMLTPRELYNAMGFPPDYIIERDYMGNAYPKSKQVARCGNAVCPPMAEAMVRANLPEYCGVTIVTMAQLNNLVAV